MTDTKSKILTDRFIEYVSISSESGNEKQICDKVYNDLCTLGLNVKKFDITGPFKSNGYNIYSFIEGEIPGEPILLNAHVDTVAPGCNIKPIIENDIIKSDGTTVLGADDKSAVTAIYSVIEHIIKESFPHKSFEVLFTVGEEYRISGIKAFDRNIIKSKIAYTFDSCNPVGGMITSAPSNATIDINVYGKSAHAGRAPEKGISAIQVASYAISKIPLLRIDEDTTCNIGKFISSFENNVVPDKAYITLAVRSIYEEKLNKQVQIIKKEFQNACDKFNARFDMDTQKIYIAYTKSNDCESVKYAKKALSKLNINPFNIRACGGSDAHILNEYGIDALNLACGNEKVHTKEECIKISELTKLYDLIITLIT